MFSIDLEIAGHPLTVEGIRGRFALSTLFRFEVDVLLDEAPPVLDALIAMPFTLKLGAHDDTTTEWHGLATEVRRGIGNRRLQLMLEPEVAQLGVGRDVRLFQEMTAVDIVKQVLDKGGIDGGTVSWSLLGNYRTRAYTVQYRESDWAFIERLMAEEGIYYYFEPAEGQTKLIFADDSTFADPIQGEAMLPFRDNGGMMAAGDAVYAVMRRAALVTDKVTLRDYSFETPQLQLEATAGDGPREAYDVHGRFMVNADGDHYALMRQQALGAPHDVISGSSSCMRLVPGLQFTLDEHPVSALNGDLLIIGLDYAMQAVEDTPSPIRWRAIPLATPYRPAPRPAAEHPEGPQTALVVGPSGEEIHSDDQGRVRAQHYWDREGQKDEQASTWMRVGQVALGGSMIMPRIGWDVLVHHDEGDVDRPAVVTHLYDGTHPVPYALPANKTRTAWQTATSPGDGSSNEMRFEDAAGSEEIFFNASKDMNVVVGDNSNDTVGVNHDHSIGANYDVSVSSNLSVGIKTTQDVTVGAAETLTISGARQVGVAGSESSTIGASRSVTVIKGSDLKVTGDRSVTVGGSMLAISALGVNRMSLGSLSATVGGSWIQAAATGLDHMTGGAVAETVGGAKISAAASGASMNVKGAAAETVGGAYIIAAAGQAVEQSTKVLAVTVGGAFIANAPEISIEAESKITVRVGGSSMTIKSSSIEIKAPLIALPAGSLGKKAGKIQHN